MWHNFHCQMARPPELARGGKWLDMPHMYCNMDDLSNISHAVIVVDTIMYPLQLQPVLSTVTMRILILAWALQSLFCITVRVHESKFSMLLFSLLPFNLRWLLSAGSLRIVHFFPSSYVSPKHSASEGKHKEQADLRLLSLWCLMSSLHWTEYSTVGCSLESLTVSQIKD